MKVLITGSNGFLGKNVDEYISKNTDFEILRFDKKNTEEELYEMCSICDVIIHLAGEARSKEKDDFDKNNCLLTKTICSNLEKSNNCVPIIFASSVHVFTDNDYGKTKIIAENIINEYAKKNYTKSFIFRLNHLFGIGGLPIRHGVVPTWCEKIAKNEEVSIVDPTIKIVLSYGYDVAKDFTDHILKMDCMNSNIYEASLKYSTTLGELSEIMTKFPKYKTGELEIPKDEFVMKLYETFSTFVD